MNLHIIIKGRMRSGRLTGNTQKGARTMSRVARILLSLGVIFLVLFISISILFFLSPARLSSTVFINPNICNVSCMCDVDICAGGGGPPPLSDITINGMLIAYQWPDQINLNSSDAISV
jgi:hypothetical protein